MSFFPGNDPTPGDAYACDAIELMLIPNARDIGGFQVRRALPTARRRLVGPFIFFDRMGPAILRADQALDVRPHPHIGFRPSPICSTARSGTAICWAPKW